jgi:hypothetical protein
VLRRVKRDDLSPAMQLPGSGGRPDITGAVALCQIEGDPHGPARAPLNQNVIVSDGALTEARVVQRSNVDDGGPVGGQRGRAAKRPIALSRSTLPPRCACLGESAIRERQGLKPYRCPADISFTEGPIDASLALPEISYSSYVLCLYCRKDMILNDFP